MKSDTRVFIDAAIRFEILGETYEFSKQPVSAYGVSGMDWGKLTSTSGFGQRFGKKIRIQVRIHEGADSMDFDCEAIVTREITQQEELFGLHFLLDPKTQSQLKKLIADKGYLPKSYTRKYPRIPSNQLIQTFPLRAMVTARTPASSGLPVDQSYIFDVANLSPTGALLSTENPNTISIVPGTRIRMALEPRGWFAKPIQTAALICRATDEINPSSGNFIRFIGVSFQEMDAANRENFLELLKDILARLKSLEP
ncbi:MAG: PilZ domain-containing protein [Bdellovibrionales bacterium]|nr:PilZ domain-containing protein [Bdellovibrionales bacterium]